MLLLLLLSHLAEFLIECPVSLGAAVNRFSRQPATIFFLKCHTIVYFASFCSVYASRNSQKKIIKLNHSDLIQSRVAVRLMVMRLVRSFYLCFASVTVMRLGFSKKEKQNIF